MENEGDTRQKEIYDTANVFVDEVLKEATAQVEASKADSIERTEGLGGIAAGILKRGTRWQNRARTVVTRLLTQLRICK